MHWIWVGLGLLVLGAVLYWQLIVAEGAYLGRHVVAWLYDISAHLYDRIKQYDSGYEQWFLGQPLSRALAIVPNPLILDVATGTARLARTLFKQPGFQGRMVGLDYSQKMLREAVRKTEPWSERLTFIWQEAGTLPFPDESFEAVACLEALEFFPHPPEALKEMIRVLRPGGILLITNRISKDARLLLPGRIYQPDAFENMLKDLDLEMVRTQTWQEDYDLIWARKAGARGHTASLTVEEVLRCPHCGGPLRRIDQTFVCPEEDLHFPISKQGIIEMARPV
ncbi:MAG: methyltransferase domain-containing protein [Anaerolineae bacterium]